MARIHKLTKNGQAICPATRMDAVVHPDLRVAASELIGEVNVSKIYPTGGTDGTDKYTLEAAVAKIPESLRSVGIKCSFTGEGGLPQTWTYMGGTWGEAGSWEQFGHGGAGDGSSVVENAAQISGLLRIIPMEEDMLNRNRFINVADGTFTAALSTNPEARIMKLNVAPFRGGTISCWNYKNGNSRACLAFYSSDFRDLPTAGLFIWAGLTGYGEDAYESVPIPENAVTAAVWFDANKGFKDVILRRGEGLSAFDEKAKEVVDGLTADYDMKGRNIRGRYSLVLEPYETRTYIDQTGSVMHGVNASHDNRTLTEVPIPENFRGGRIGFYTSYFLNSSLAMLAFYNADDTPLEVLKTVNTNHEYREADIPVGAVLARVVLNSSFPEGKTRADYPVTLYAAEDSLTVYENSRKIQAGHKDYPLPLGVMDNLLVDVSSYNAVSKQFFITSPFSRDTGGMLYQVYARRSVRTNAGTVNMDVTFVFRIKKSANPDRLLRLVNTGGAAAEFNDDAQPGPLYHQNSILMGYLIRQEKEYLWVYGRTKDMAGQQEVRIVSYADSSKQEYEELEIDMDRSFVITGNYELEELDIDRKYYTRPEKLHSNLVGKTCIIFADSLSAFVNSLAQDWGMNIVSMAEGGNRMGYYTGALSNWICEDEKVQNFRSYGLQRADYIVFAMGANDPSFTQCTADDVQFVLQNKRWFDSDAETDPFDALEEDGKSRFASAASLYAAAYSLCRLYPGTQVAIIPPYRTPGVGCTDYDVATYCSALFSGRFVTLTEQLREVATTLGALFIENKTRLTVASADYYHHGADGVHPNEFAVYQDMASNIGHALSRYYDSIESIAVTD